MPQRHQIIHINLSGIFNDHLLLIFQKINKPYNINFWERYRFQHIIMMVIGNNTFEKKFPKNLHKKEIFLIFVADLKHNLFNLHVTYPKHLRQKSLAP